MKFGETIVAQQQNSAWAPYYLNYSALKQILEEHKQQEQQQQQQHEQDVVSLSSYATSTNLLFPADTHPVTAEFLYELHAQVEMIVLFVLQEQGKIASELLACRNELQACLEAANNHQLDLSPPPQPQLYGSLGDESSKWSAAAECYNADSEKLHSLEEHYCRVGLNLLQLYRFVDVNVTGIRKILKKHDKLLPRCKISLALLSSLNSFNENSVIASPPSRGGIFQRRRLTADGYGRMLVKPLLRDESLGALTATLEAGLQELRGLHQQSFHDAPTPPLITPFHHRTISSPDMESRETYGSGSDQISPLKKMIASSTIGTISERYPGKTPIYQSVTIHDHKSYRPNVVGRSLSAAGSGRSSGVCNADSVLLQIQAARRRLQQTSSYVQLLAASMMVASDGEEGTEADEDGIIVDEEDDEERKGHRNYSNTLNLFSSMLYMCNYYIVAPTSGSYAEKVGGTAAMASMIIGMTSVAALVSTVLFSWWTSYSYRSALIFASTCSVLGNLFYAAGLPFGSLPLVMIGRLLNGFGSARSINRRYICDTFPREERTAASAAFVTAGALGMAAGPAISSVLHYFTTDRHGNELNDSIYWQAENAPGWFMFVTWLVYLVCLILYFENPPKKKDAAKKVDAALELSGRETKPLLGNGDARHNEQEVTKEPPIWENTPVMMTFVIYFVLKLVLEAILSSAATLTKLYFGWHSGRVGIYLAVLGLLMLPANLCVAYLARSYDDRELIIGLQVIMFLGCVAILRFTSVYRLPQYLLASVALFISATALEGPNMSLLSKTIPKSWSKGIFNVGLLATEAGTFGRAVSDVLLAVFGSDGLEHLLNRTFGSFSIVCLITLLFSYGLYDQLEPSERDDY